MKRRNFIGRSGSSGRSSDVAVLHSIHIPGAKHFRIKRDGQYFIFSAISQKQLKEIPNARVVGRFSTSSRKRSSAVDAFDSNRRFEIQKQLHGQAAKISFDIYNAPRRFYIPKAYVPIGNDEFLVYEKSAFGRVAIPAAAAAIAIVVGILSLADDIPVNPLGIAPTVEIGGDGSESTEMETIDFAGFESMTVSDGNPYVLLQNPESNDVYFSYVLSDESGKEIRTTDLIPPGKVLQWDAKADLGRGVHTVNMHVDTYDMENTGIPYNAMNYDNVTVTVQ